MNEPGNDLLEIVLRECGRLAPQPLYPAEFTQGTGVARPRLDAALDDLRLGGLVRLTEWKQGLGQGYTLTDEGAELLHNPRLLDHLRRNGAAPQAVAPPLRPVATERATPWERGETIRKALLEPARPTITLLLIALNVLVFVVGMGLAVQRKVPLTEYLAFSAKDARVYQIHHELGALDPTDVANGQWWRLVTCAFVHVGGGLHILMNMYFLYSIGPLVESIFGRVRYLALYLTGALGCGAAVVLVHQAAGGASGALCGVFAALLVWVLTNRRHLPAPLASAWTRNLLMNVVLIVFISLLPGISAAGHLGGGLAGAAFTLPFVWERYHTGVKRWLGLAGMAAVPLAILGLVGVRLGAEMTPADLRAVADAEKAAVRAYNQHAVTLLNKPLAKLFDEPDASDALVAFREAHDKLNSALEALGKEAPAGQDVQPLRDYLRAWDDFFTAFVDVLDRRTEWNAEQRQNLVDKYHEVDRISKAWRKEK